MEELLKPVDKKALALPNEPYTPTIKGIEMDYHAIANTDDIELIHLYPFVNSSKTEHLELGPTLLPTFVNEGTLFIGLDSIRPGSGLQLLFQFAEEDTCGIGKRPCGYQLALPHRQSLAAAATASRYLPTTPIG